MALWIIIVLLTAAILGVLIVPLLLRGAARAAARGEYDLSVFRDQLAEVDRDAERGLLGDSEAKAARIEIKRRMLALAPTLAESESRAKATTGGPSAVNPIVMAGLAIIVPVGALTLYLALGSPGVPDLPLASRQAEIRQEVQRDEDMERLVADLAEKMKANPDNAEGWNLLARSYRNAGRYGEAVNAFERVVQLTGRDPDVLAEYGEALIMQAEGAVTPAAEAIFREVMDQGGADPRALFYTGVARAQQGDVKGAMDAWVLLTEVSPADAPWLPEVRQRIRAAAGELGLDPPAVALQPPSATQPSAETPPSSGPSREEVEAARQMPAAERDAMIRSMVQRLADRLKENPGDREGWVRLERAYRVLGETEKADEAKARIEALQ